VQRGGLSGEATIDSWETAAEGAAAILASWQPGIILPSLDLPTGLQTKRSKVAVDDGWGRRVVRVVRVVEWDSVGEAEACLREAFELGSGEATKYNVL
jgi:hypothetical protein